MRRLNEPIESGQIRELVDRIEASARSYGFSEVRIEDIRTAVIEACQNAMEYGDARTRPPEIEASFEEGVLVVSATSAGHPFRIADMTPDIEGKMQGRESARGWGLFLMRRLADDVALERTGEINTVRMKFRLHEEKGEPKRD